MNMTSRKRPAGPGTKAHTQSNQARAYRARSAASGRVFISLPGAAAHIPATLQSITRPDHMTSPADNAAVPTHRPPARPAGPRASGPRQPGLYGPPRLQAGHFFTAVHHITPTRGPGRRDASDEQPATDGRPCLDACQSARASWLRDGSPTPGPRALLQANRDPRLTAFGTNASERTRA